MNSYVVCKMEGPLAVVTLQRPEALNALNSEVLTQLYETMDMLDRNDEVKVVILTGAGEKAFAAGADITAMQKMTPKEAFDFSGLGHRTMDKIAEMHPFVIAAVNGYALGGGCELAMACDIRIVSTNAQFAIPETGLGVIPGFGGTQRLPRLVGLGRAKEMLATGRRVKATEALQIGLAEEVAEPEKLLEVCKNKARRISENSRTAIALGKQAMMSGIETDLKHGLMQEAELFALTFSMPDQAEGMSAFLEKRKAVFSSSCK